MSLNKYVFIIDTAGRQSGTPNTGTVYSTFNIIPTTEPFYLRLTMFNMIFSAPNISPSKGNSIQCDDGTNIITVILPTGAYGVGSTNDLGNAVAAALTAADAGLANIVFTSTYNDATNLYTLSGTKPFKLIFNLPSSIKTQYGFDNSLVAATSQVASRYPNFYDNHFQVQIYAENATTQFVKIPSATGVTQCSFVVPRRVDFGGQLSLSESEVAPQYMRFNRCPTQISWNLTRPNGQPLEQQLDWTAIFSVEQDK